MKYVALDIETTGLDPDCCAVLSIAMVVDDASETEIDHLPYFDAVIRHEGFWGEPHALAMNAHLIMAMAALPERLPMDRGYCRIGDREVLLFDDLEAAAVAARKWLCSVFDAGLPDRSVVVAGRNVAGFDLRFLPEHLTSVFHHRCLDVASMAMGARPDLWQDRRTLPNTSTLIGEPAEHTALGDARQVVKAVRTFRTHRELENAAYKGDPNGA